jgi:hypothetical protein
LGPEVNPLGNYFLTFSRKGDRYKNKRDFDIINHDTVGEKTTHGAVTRNISKLYPNGMDFKFKAFANAE